MQKVSCVICGFDEYTILYPSTLSEGDSPDVRAFRCTSNRYGDHHQIVRCVRCAHIYANPRWSADELMQAYTNVEDETYLEERKGREMTFQKHLHHLEKIVGPSNGRTLLDVGAYIGVFVEEATKAGWNAMGVEPSAWCTKIAAEQGINVLQGTLDHPSLQAQQFDVITLWDVIEHVDDPPGELRKAYELLVPGGVVVIHTMNIDSLTAILMGKRWPWLLDMHVNFFSKKSLCQLLESLGFHVLWAGARGRYLRLHYVASRLEGLFSFLGKFFGFLFKIFLVESVSLPVNFYDLMTVYAEKPTSSSPTVLRPLPPSS